MLISKEERFVTGELLHAMRLLSLPSLPLSLSPSLPLSLTLSHSLRPGKRGNCYTGERLIVHVTAHLHEI